jgi:hypothetical protein
VADSESSETREYKDNTGSKQYSYAHTNIPTQTLQLFGYIHTANRSFENASKFKYLGMAVTIQNLIQDKIKKKLYSGNARYHSYQNLLSSRLLSKNV